MQSLLVILEALGLLIAVLDFIGVSPKIQAWIDRQRKKYFIWLYQKEHEKFAESTSFLVCFSIPLWVSFAWFWYALATKSAMATPLFLTWLIIALVPPLLIYILLPLIYNVLLTINRVPSKTVGTVAFSIAIASSILQRVWQHTHPLCSH